MTLQTPPYALQAASHGAELFRRALQASIAGTGVVASGDLQVTQNGTPNMSVNVAPGQIWIPGTLGGTTSTPANLSAQTAYGLPSSLTSQGSYYAMNDATVNLAIAAANATNPRIDIVCASIQDAFYSGSTNTAVLQVITGTAAPSPSPPSAPANSVVLAQVAVAANATQITTANITAKRPFLQRLYALQRNIYQTSVHATGASTLANNAYTPLTMAGVDYDPSGAWNGTTTFTAPVGGRYLIDGHVALAATATQFVVAVFKNGSQARNGTMGYAASPASNSSSVTCVLSLVAGDTIQLQAYQNTGGAANNTVSAADTFLDIVFLGAS